MFEVNFALKLQIEMLEQSAQEVDGHSRICNWLFNHLVEKASKLRQEFITTGNPEVAKTLYTQRGLRNLVPQIKQENSFLKIVHSSLLKNTALRVTDAISAHQKSKKGKRKGEVVGWPKFRSWKKKWFSLYYDEPGKGFSVKGQTLSISLGLGKDRKRKSLEMKLPEAHLLKGKIIRSLRIVKELGQYYAIFIVQQEPVKKKKISKVIAIDPNHKNLGYGVDTDGTAIEIQAPCWLKKYDYRLDELKSKRDRCNAKAKKNIVLDENNVATGKEFFTPSKRWAKYDRALKRALHKRREQTKTFMFTSAHKLYKEYDCIGIGNYTPQGAGITKPMRRAMNNRSLIGRWKKILSWVACKSGKSFLEFEEKGTTRTCHSCLYVEERGIGLSIRQWQCPQCKTEHIRDENAAQNGLRRVLRDLSKEDERENLSIVSGSDLAFIKKRWAWCVLPSGVKVISRR